MVTDGGVPPETDDERRRTASDGSPTPLPAKVSEKASDGGMPADVRVTVTDGGMPPETDDERRQRASDGSPMLLPAGG